MNPTVVVKVWGEFALFTRPELKVERVSYPFMTPSAARGVLDAILFKPQMRWRILRITALDPWWLTPDPGRSFYRLIGIRRNEIQGKIAPNAVSGWMNDPATFEPYLVDSAGREGAQGQNRTQRAALVLQHVAYTIHATPMLTAKANRPRVKPEDADEEAGPDSPAKYAGMFERRVRKGQCFHRPYLGCREFACEFAPLDGTEKPLSGWNEALGMMLYDIRFGIDHGGDGNRPGYFRAEVKAGVLNCDTAGNPPVRVLGWEEGGAM